MSPWFAVTTEAQIRDLLAVEENGTTEVVCPTGRVDVVTATELIEVKKVSDYKHAVGQVLAYHNCDFPLFRGKTPRVHLFLLGPLTTAKENLIRKTCAAVGVRVTFEIAYR